jgi:hypothetical protein
MPWWKERIVGPVAVNLITTFLIFVASLSIPSVREWVFGVHRQASYPLFCRFEPVFNGTNSDEAERLLIEVLITNISSEKDGQDSTSLARILKQIYGADTTHHPLIVLQRNWQNRQPVEELVEAYDDKEFNRGKGELIVETDPDSGDITIRVNRIGPRTTLRANIVLDKVPDLSRNVDRRTYHRVPFDVIDLETNCFS